MKRSWLMLVGTLVLLSGCGAGTKQAASSSTSTKSSQKQSSSKSTSSKTSSNKSSSASSSSTKTLAWSATQNQRLLDFMTTFGSQMNQAYTEWQVNAAPQWFGLDLAQYYGDHPEVTLNGAKQTVNWMPTAGQFSQDAANIVAAYVDTHDTILYLFAIMPDGTGQAWVVQQAGMPATVKQTSNQQVSSAFTTIVNGQTPSNSSANSNATSVNTKNLTQPQIKTWILHNLQKQAPAYAKYTVDAFDWTFSTDQLGESSIEVSVNHAYTNAHYGTNADPNSTEEVGLFVINSKGQLTVANFGSFGSEAQGPKDGSNTIIATSYN